MTDDFDPFQRYQQPWFAKREASPFDGLVTIVGLYLQAKPNVVGRNNPYEDELIRQVFNDFSDLENSGFTHSGLSNHRADGFHSYTSVGRVDVYGLQGGPQATYAYLLANDGTRVILFEPGRSGTVAENVIDGLYKAAADESQLPTKMPQHLKNVLQAISQPSP